MLVPMKCPVCNGFHSFRYERLLQCVRKQPKGQVEYVRYRVWWRDTEITVRPNAECWKRKFGLSPFLPRRFPMKQGWKYLCGLKDLDYEKFSGGKYMQVKDFDVAKEFLVFEVFGFEKWLKVSRGSFQWMEKYDVNPGDDFTIWLCGCDNCKRTKDFEMLLDGRKVLVEFYGRWVSLQFPVGELEATVEWSSKHTDWEEEIMANWRKFKKASYVSVSVLPILDPETPNFVKKVRVKHGYLGKIYIDTEGNVTFE